MIITSIMRGYGDAKTPMFVNIGVNIVNVIGNFLLIYPTRTMSLFGMEFTMIGAGWGVAGAAAATSGSATIGALIMLAVLFLKKGAHAAEHQGTIYAGLGDFKNGFPHQPACGF